MKPFLFSLLLVLCSGHYAIAQYACSAGQFMNGTIANIGMQCGALPAQTQSDWNSVTAPAAILNKPTIPAAQVNSDWNATSGLPQILNKPALATVATSGAYADLTGKPTIPTVPKIFSGSTTTNASGVASFTVTSAGFTAAPTSCSFTATSGTAVAANSYNTTGSVATAWTSSAVAAFVTQPISILLGGLGVALVGSGITVQATCFGS